MLAFSLSVVLVLTGTAIEVTEATTGVQEEVH